VRTGVEEHVFKLKKPNPPVWSREFLSFYVESNLPKIVGPFLVFQSDHSSNRVSFAVPVSGLGQPAAQAQAPDADAAAGPPGGYTIVEDEVLIHFKATATAQDQADAEAAASVTQKKHVHTPTMKAAAIPGCTWARRSCPCPGNRDLAQASGG